jgi:putative transcriptional regulator
MMDEKGYLNGHMLIAMPAMADPRFQRTVLYLCTHSSQGAMGIVVNRVFGEVTFRELLGQLGIPTGIQIDRQVHFGGPVESGRGFVLHSTDVVQKESLVVADGVALTGTLDILRAIAEGEGPRQSLFALGYAGWGPGQLADRAGRSLDPVRRQSGYEMGAGAGGARHRPTDAVGGSGPCVTRVS